MYLDTSSDTIKCLTMSLLDEIADENNLMKAFNRAKIGCDWKYSVQAFDLQSLVEVGKLHKELMDHTYKPRPYFEFILNERGKVRHIKACNIRDRVVQKSLCENALNKILVKYLIYDNGASLKGKGIDFARRRLEAHLDKYYKEYKTNEGYVLLIDFKKFFDSIPHDKLIAMIEEKLPDDSINWLIELIINSFGGDKGLGIGSQLSQICGLFYPTKIDTYCKVVKGMKYYGRYMDDIYIICRDKETLRRLLKELQARAKEIGLVINMKKTQIVKLDRQFVFLKTRYSLLKNGHLVKKIPRDMITRERRKIKKYANTIIPYRAIENAYHSWRGNAIKYDAKKSVEKLDLLFDELYIVPFITGEYVEIDQRRCVVNSNIDKIARALDQDSLIWVSARNKRRNK